LPRTKLSRPASQEAGQETGQSQGREVRRKSLLQRQRRRKDIEKAVKEISPKYYYFPIISFLSL
jgi:hypothetical protein